MEQRAFNNGKSGRRFNNKNDSVSLCWHAYSKHSHTTNTSQTIIIVEAGLSEQCIADLMSWHTTHG